MKIVPNIKAVVGLGLQMKACVKEQMQAVTKPCAEICNKADSKKCDIANSSYVKGLNLFV
jgi:hypothetical protein